MTPKHERFIAEYLIDQNGQQAAVRAGYSPHAARIQASKLLTNPNIKAELTQRTAALLASRVATAQQVLERLTLIGLANPKRFVDATGAYRGLEALSDDDAAAIAQVDIVQANLDPSDGKRDSARVVKIRLHDAVRALETLAKYHGLAQPTRVEIGLSDGLIAQLHAARARLLEAPAVEGQLLTEEDRHASLRDNTVPVQVPEGQDRGQEDSDPSRD